MTELKSQITDFIVDNYMFGEKGDLRENTSLLAEGIIDSQGVLELVFFLESNMSIKIHDDELIPDNLDSINRIAAFVEKKILETQPLQRQAAS